MNFQKIIIEIKRNWKANESKTFWSADCLQNKSSQSSISCHLVQCVFDISSICAEMRNHLSNLQDVPGVVFVPINVAAICSRSLQ